MGCTRKFTVYINTLRTDISLSKMHYLLKLKITIAKIGLLDHLPSRWIVLVGGWSRIQKLPCMLSEVWARWHAWEFWSHGTRCTVTCHCLWMRARASWTKSLNGYLMSHPLVSQLRRLTLVVVITILRIPFPQQLYTPWIMPISSATSCGTLRSLQQNPHSQVPSSL